VNKPVFSYLAPNPMKSYQSYQNQTKNVQNEQTKALFRNKMTFLSKVKLLKILFTQLWWILENFGWNFIIINNWKRFTVKKIESVKSLFLWNFVEFYEFLVEISFLRGFSVKKYSSGTLIFIKWGSKTWSWCQCIF